MMYIQWSCSICGKEHCRKLIGNDDGVVYYLTAAQSDLNKVADAMFLLAEQANLSCDAPEERLPGGLDLELWNLKNRLNEEL